MNKTDIIFIRNYMNQDLLEKTKLNNVECLYINGGNGLYGLKLLEEIFIKRKLQDKYKYVVLVDEDCLITNINSVFGLIQNMELNNFDMCGVPDGGCVNIRGHRADVPNLFFTIIKTDKLKIFNADEYKNFNVPVKESLLPNVKYDIFEPYYKFLTYLIYKLNFTFLNLRAKESDCDAITTIVIDGNGKDFAYHTWYARKYNIDKEHTDRINRIIDKNKR